MEWRRRDRIVDQENLQPVEVVLDALAQDRKRTDTITEEKRKEREREREREREEQVRNRRKRKVTSARHETKKKRCGWRSGESGMLQIEPLRLPNTYATESSKRSQSQELQSRSKRNGYGISFFANAWSGYSFAKSKRLAKTLQLARPTNVRVGKASR